MNKLFKGLMLLCIAAATFTSCSEDEVKPTISLSQRALFFSKFGQAITITYDGSNIESLKSSNIPTDWGVSINTGNSTITVTAPSDPTYFDLSFEASDITFTATSKDDQTSYAYLSVGATTNKINLTDQYSNSFVVSQANTVYSIGTFKKGENGEEFTPKSAKLLWQSANRPIAFVKLIDGVVQFYLNNDEDDSDEDGLESDPLEGNAVIALYNNSGSIIWSWHIWSTSYKPNSDVVSLNGSSIMSRNLGAAANGFDSESEILASYGLYYQWGRKTPFPTPNTYNAAKGVDATLCNEFGRSVLIDYKESTSSIGTESYAAAHPLVYITGVEASGYDWLYNNHSSSLWSESKSNNDPCPKGWRVTSPEVYEGLAIPTLTEETLSDIASDYGWQLSDAAGNSELFMGLGRRGQITGKIQNVNTNETRPTPWVGYYWSTASAENNRSESMHFYYDALSLEDCGINANERAYRATGMQIRCQRE